MTDERLHKPVPVGELLERLHAEGFAIGPGDYDRVFNVIGRIFPDGLPADANSEVVRTLRELISPIVCRTAIEQEKFAELFNTFIRTPDTLSDWNEEDKDEKEPDVDIDVPVTSNPLRFLWLLIPLFIVGAILWFLFFSDKPQKSTDETDTKPDKPSLNCAVNFAVQSVQGDSITFINSSPGLQANQVYQWNFGDGSDSVVTSNAVVGHRFKTTSAQARLGKVTLQPVGCTSEPQTYQEPSPYKPKALAFRRSPEQANYKLAGWMPLILMGMGGLLSTGFAVRMLRQKRKKKAPRPADGPFFLSFPHQEDGIQPSLSLLNWAQQLQQREESERRMLAIGPSIWQTIRNGGMPTLRYEQIKHRPRYLVLLDNRSAYDQQAQLYNYLTGVLTTRDVDMDVFFFHADPRYAWSDLYPKGLPIADIYRLYGTHYLVLVTEGNRLLDYNTGEVAAWVSEALEGWTNRALLTPVYPQNWNYLEAALSRFFILLPTTPDGQLRLRDYFGQSESTPTYDDLLRQFDVQPGTPNRGIFGRPVAKLSIADVEQFLRQSPEVDSVDRAMQDWLIQWACATAVFPTPDWSITLAIGKAFEQEFIIEGLVTTTNLMKLTALPWLRQDTIPEPLRTSLLTNLRADIIQVARKAVARLLNELRPAPGSVAYEEWQLRLWEQEYHIGQTDLKQLAPYHDTDLVKDTDIREQLHRQHKKAQIKNQYIPLALLLLLTLAPLLLYLAPPKTQMAAWAVPFYRLDSSSIDSAAYYNNQAIDVFTKPSRKLYETRHEEAVTLLYESLRQRLTFDAVYNLNVARYNLGVSLFDRTANSYGARDLVSLDKRVSPNDGVLTLMRPFKQFDENWVPDSSLTRNYLMLLTTNDSADSIYQYIQSVNRASISGTQSRGIQVGNQVSQQSFSDIVVAAKQVFRTPGRLELTTSRYVTRQDSLALVAFEPTNLQLDSLVSLEAARAVLYFGGPRQTTTIPVEASMSAPPSEVLQTESATTPSTEPIRPSKAKPTTQKTTTNKASKRSPAKTLNPQYTEAPRQNAQASGTILAQQRPVADSGRAQSTSETLPATAAPANNPLSNNPNYSPVQQQVQQQPVQQQQVQQELPIAEQIKTLGLRQVSSEQAKCDETDVTISVQDGNQQIIRSGQSVLIPLAQQVESIDWYCGSNQQKIYSKRPFNYIAVERTTAGLIQWTLYRESPKAAR